MRALKQAKEVYEQILKKEPENIECMPCNTYQNADFAAKENTNAINRSPLLSKNL
jgi:hypothetical protein